MSRSAPPEACACLSSCAPTRAPPSLLKLRRSTSVVTSWRVAAAGALASAPGTALAPAEAGLLEALGSDASAFGAGAPWAGAVTAGGVLLGKNVAGLPLWICHLSQMRTMAKPNTTHRMERRMSFMTRSCFRGFGEAGA